MLATLREQGVLVLAAEPGAGKTTRLPPAMLPEVAGQVLCLQPRRVAARAAAERVAAENHWTLGREVGYHVRFDRVASPTTRLLFLTEGVLTARLLDDPLLEGVGCVILDEFHERSVHADLALAMLREVRAARPELRVCVMSATLDAGPVADFLGGRAVAVSGRVFPVDIEHTLPPGRRGPRDLAAAVADMFDRERPDGDTLIFLPGAAEIDAAVRELRGVDARPLHGGLPFEEQRRALEPSDAPRVICATNIAETSLTIDGVTLVIDTGLARQASYDERRGMDRLDTVPISQASAKQRAGRAGRTRPGRCVRLWSAREHHARPAHDLPELARIDPAEALLAVYGWSSPVDFDWFEPPPAERVAAAEKLLAMLGAVADGKLTAIGRAIRSLPTHPRLGRLLIEASGTALADDAAWLAAVLGERGAAGDPVDLAARLEQARRRDDPIGQRLRRAAEQLGRRTRSTGPISRRPTALSTLALVAFPDRVCRMRPPTYQQGTSATGGVRLASPLPTTEPFVVALDARRDGRTQSNEATVTLAAGVSQDALEATLPQLIREEDSAEYVPERDRIDGVRRRWLGGLLLEEKRGVSVADEAARQALHEHAAQVEAGGDPTLLRRIAFVTNRGGGDFLPDYEAHLRTAIDATPSARSLREVRRLADELFAADLAAQLPALDRLAPLTVTVPTGSRVKLDWSVADEQAPPVLAVKLQELFGLAATPRVGPPPGVPVTLHLLGPNYRPVQVTSDLASFWQNTYPQVRKDLRARYPKHFWPEDPTTAPPTRGTKRRPRQPS